MRFGRQEEAMLWDLLLRRKQTTQKVTMDKAKRMNDVINATIKIHNRMPKNDVCLESFSVRYDICDDILY